MVAGCAHHDVRAHLQHRAFARSKKSQSGWVVGRAGGAVHWLGAGALGSRLRSLFEKNIEDTRSSAGLLELTSVCDRVAPWQRIKEYSVGGAMVGGRFASVP